MIGGGYSSPLPILFSMSGGGNAIQIGTVPAGFPIFFVSFGNGLSLVTDPAQPNTFYLSGGGIQKTSDGGRTWSILGGVPVPAYGYPVLLVNPLQHSEILMVKGTGTDALVSSFSADLSILRFSTYFGGNGDEFVSGLALGPDDSITIVGYTTSTDLAQIYGSSSDVRAGTNDIFVARLSGDGTSKLAFRLLGGSGSEYVSGAALDGAGNLIIGGGTNSPDYPVTSNAPFSKKPQGSSTNSTSFLTVLAPDLSLRYSTFLGGNGSDSFFFPGLLPDGRVWLTGTTTSTDLLTSNNALYPLPLGYEDVYLMLMDWRP